MTLWLILISMTAAALAGIVWPFAFSGAMASSGSEVEVYRDQLLEIDRDREAGSIGGADAEAARIEVSRRLLKAANLPMAIDRQSQAKMKECAASRFSQLAWRFCQPLPVARISGSDPPTRLRLRRLPTKPHPLPTTP